MTQKRTTDQITINDVPVDGTDGVNKTYADSTIYDDTAIQAEVDLNTAKVGVTDEISNVVEDTTPQLGGDLDANGNAITDVHEIRIDAVPDTDHTANGPTTNSINAGATISAFELCYLASDGEWAKADASAVATGEGMLALSLASGTDGSPMKVALSGAFIRDDTWAWTVGGEIYMSETAGALTQTAPTTADSLTRIIGYAISADVMYFKAENTIVIHS